ncbi:NAD(P)-binding domain-containing protein [Actinoallomurus purpureus]|uniref:NADPH-dependent F420 reductase n=1 Tax=Actinoallomurus purpureus TaxID=478114 RepID=UPI002092DD18|nr:NAD(P)-binding domain-containing protein [Actinoallomurus purpureus]MCO6004064.1 NAD(P)-binding domain-containing protein [Actinoallomurus purpureus]
MTEANGTRRIGLLGAGNIGRPIGRHWLAAGHTVTFGSRSPQRLASFIGPLGPGARAASYADAATAGDVVMLAVPYQALDELLDTVRDRLAGKIVIDAANPMGLSPDGRIISTLEPGVTQGRRTADLLPGSTVVRAFTHVMDELLWSRGTRQRHFWGMALAGDDAEAKDLVSNLILDAGFTPVDLGGLENSSALDPGGPIFPHMFTPADLRATVTLVG